jgi:hypothetical protein
LTAAQAPHLALHAPHFALTVLFLLPFTLLAAHFDLYAPHLALDEVACLSQHLAPAQLAAITFPESAAAVTTADAMVLAILDDRLLMGCPCLVESVVTVEKHGKSRTKRSFRGYSRTTAPDRYIDPHLYRVMQTAEGEMAISFGRMPILRLMNALGTTARNTCRCEHTEVQPLQNPGH